MAGGGWVAVTSIRESNLTFCVLEVLGVFRGVLGGHKHISSPSISIKRSK